MVWQLHEKYVAVNKRLYIAFLDLEKAFDHVTGKVIWRALRELGVEKWIVRLVQGSIRLCAKLGSIWRGFQPRH